jgi:hypothetical protein
MLLGHFLSEKLPGKGLMDLTQRITEVLAPHLGHNTADAVARHLCAKHGIGEGPVDASAAQTLEETIRRGLVAFVGPERAADLAKQCFRQATAP